MTDAKPPCRLCDTPDTQRPRPTAETPLCPTCAKKPELVRAVQWVADNAAIEHDWTVQENGTTEDHVR